MSELFANHNAYLAYFAALMAAALLLWVLGVFGIGVVPVLVKRGETSLGTIHGTFVAVTIINLGIGQIVFPLLPDPICQYAFVMMLLESFAWAY